MKVGEFTMLELQQRLQQCSGVLVVHRSPNIHRHLLILSVRLLH